jgi:uncharacterized protein (TIGR02588 family)
VTGGAEAVLSDRGSPAPPERALRRAQQGRAEGPESRPVLPGAPPITGWEWLVAALGLVLVLTTVTYLLVQAMRGPAVPPDVVVRVDSIAPTSAGGYLVQFRAANAGDETAAGLTVVGELRDASGVETSRTPLDYLPGHSERGGGLFFRRDPRRATVRLWAEGYQEP